jgi:hypothetical protein
MHRTNRCALFGLMAVFLFIGTIPALANGEQVIPHLTDGSGVIRTKIDLSNLSSTTVITRMKIYFFLASGDPWVVATNLGTASEFQLDLGKNQSARIQTSGLSAGLVSGYAVIRSFEWNPATSTDWRLGVSVFYEVLSGGQVVDTVSVPNAQPTLHWLFPAEFDYASDLFSGFALVNLADSDNEVSLQLWASFTPPSADASNAGSATITLKPGEKFSQFLHEKKLFPPRNSFRGVLVGTASKPVAVVALLQTRTPSGPQYATLSAEYLDAQHTEGFVYLADDLHLDADIPVAHYVTLDDSGSSDLHYQFTSSEVHRLVPRNGAGIAVFGIRSLNELNDISLDQLRNLSYSAQSVDMSDFTGRMTPGFTFALRTALGRLAKVRVAQVIQRGYYKDLALQIFTYR